MIKKRAIYVPVGEFRVTNDEMIELWTVTASCVALILTDTVHHIIGMLHVVLPGRRSDLRADDRHAYFADTGAPLLIQEMLKAGADKNCLSAILAGGGSLFQWQEGVDIGRENVAAVTACLNAHGIPIIRNETGGTDGRRVILKSGFHDLLIEPIKYRQPDSRVSLAGQPSTDLSPYIDELEKVPTDTSLREALLSELHVQEINRKSVCTFLSMDPILTLFFFRLINSHYYGDSVKITSFSTARKLISRPQFRRICLLTSFSGNKEAKPPLSETIIRDWKHHSLAVAFIARHLSATILPELKEEAYISGLLHSLGDLCLALKNPDRATSTIDGSTEEDFKTGLSLSADLMQFWHFPDIFPTVVSPDAPSDFNPKHRTEILSGILHVSCWLSRLIGITTQVEPYNFSLNKEVVKTLGLSDSIHTLLPPILNELEALGLKEWIKK